MNNTLFTHRQQARIIIEALTPLKIGSGRKDIISDSLVATDSYGLPYIPGTSIAGLFRSFFLASQKAEDDTETEPGQSLVEQLFGWQEADKGEGSLITFSDGRILNSKGEVMDGFCPDAFSDPLLTDYQSLPVRQHVRISAAGTAEDKGKYDEQVLYTGTRFCFQVELRTQSADTSQLHDIISLAGLQSFRMGAGSRKGFGMVQVIAAGIRDFDLTDTTGDLVTYLKSTSKLDNNWEGWQQLDITPIQQPKEWLSYQLTLRAKDFFMFGSGMADDEGNADMAPVMERVVTGPDHERRLSEPCILIPGASIKGAIAHRVAYHYNRLNGWFAGNPLATTGDSNEAVRQLFGSNQGTITRGNVLISDVLLRPQPEAQKLLNHVAIDQFTGGSMAKVGALFTELVSNDTQQFTIRLDVNTQAFSNPTIADALDATLDDIQRGRLPLGGGINRGLGSFTSVV